MVGIGLSPHSHSLAFSYSSGTPPTLISRFCSRRYFALIPSFAYGGSTLPSPLCPSPYFSLPLPLSTSHALNLWMCTVVPPPSPLVVSSFLFARDSATSCSSYANSMYMAAYPQRSYWPTPPPLPSLARMPMSSVTSPLSTSTTSSTRHPNTPDLLLLRITSQPH